MEVFFIIKILFVSTLAFAIAMALTPAWTRILYKYKLGKVIRNNGRTPIYSKLHADKSGTPTMGGVLIWLTVLILAVIFYYLSRLTGLEIFANLNFLSRNETLLPLGALVASALFIPSLPR